MLRGILFSLVGTMLGLAGLVSADEVPIEFWFEQIVINGDESKMAAIAHTSTGKNLVAIVSLPNHSQEIVDLSRLETALFAKLGVAGRDSYSKYEITPVKWVDSPDGVDILRVQLRAWQQGSAIYCRRSCGN